MPTESAKSSDFGINIAVTSTPTEKHLFMPATHRPIGKRLGYGSGRRTAPPPGGDRPRNPENPVKPARRQGMPNKRLLEKRRGLGADVVKGKPDPIRRRRASGGKRRAAATRAATAALDSPGARSRSIRPLTSGTSTTMSNLSIIGPEMRGQ